MLMAAAAAQLAERVLCVPVVGWFLGCGGGSPSQTAFDDVPADYLTLYIQAATTCPGLSWTTLAAIGKVESDHGRSRMPGVTNGTNTAGAGGPMQFLAPTFTEVVDRHPPPSGGASPPSLYNPHDAVYAAAAYLCDNHAASDLPSALWDYNHSDIYVAQIITQSDQYSQPTSNPSVECQLVQSTVQSGSDGFSSAALTAVAYACAQIGKPYVWGGNGDPGFDCSGLTHMAYAAVGIQIPRTAQTQYDAGPLLPTGMPIQPGDLVFFGTPGNIHHVGISLGGTMMVDAPDFGRTVTERDFSSFPDYAGASRPAR